MNEKMSKSRGNVVDFRIHEVEHMARIRLRLYEMFMGPLEQVKPWSTAGVEGVYQFLPLVRSGICLTKTMYRKR